MKWQEIFQPVLTAAMTDRLTHKSYVLNMNGPSFRMRETEEWLKNKIGRVCSNLNCEMVHFSLASKYKTPPELDLV